MTARRLLTISRLLVAVLFCNIASSAALASMGAGAQGNQQKYSWLCTSQGLVKVALDSEAESSSTSELRTQHCVYCKFIDHPVSLADPGLNYPQPSVVIQQHYLAPATKMSLKPILSEIYLRAPPLTILV